jgi:hypothetical protein
MRINQSLQWWTGALMFTLVLSLVLFAYVARKPLCIDSKLVERIDSVSGTGTASAYRCGLRKHVDFDPILASQARDFSRKFQKLERFFDLLGPLKSRINLTIISGKGTYFRVHDHDLVLSESILKSSGELEKALLRIWFRERSSTSLQSQPLIEESLTDLLYFAFAGQLDLKNAKTGMSLQSDREARWPRILSTMKGYCQSLWTSTEDLKDCSEKIPDMQQIHIQSLRPLLSQAMIESYSSLGAEDQILFLKDFSKNLAAGEFQEKNFGRTDAEPFQQGYQEAASQLENWNYFFNRMAVHSDSAQKFSMIFESALKRRGFDSDSHQSYIDILVFTENLKPEQSKDLLQQIEKNERDLIAVEFDKGQIQMNFGYETVDSRIMSPILASNGLYLHCGIPNLYQIGKFAKRVQKLIYVHYCPGQKIRLEGLFSDGIKTFAVQNPDLKFAEFHMPSLMLAIQKMPGLNPLQLLTQHKPESLQKLGWQKPHYDKSINAFRAESVIEMVNWYRL